MGYPASAALLFKALSEEQDIWLHNDAKRLVENFSLFAIILADPVKDLCFYQSLQKDFSFYDRLTGNNFLFFSIVKDADEERFLGANKRFRLFNDVGAYKENAVAELVDDSNIVIHAICTILGVSYDSTPCLIVSNNIRFGSFCKISTGINILEQQLINLRQVADYFSNHSLHSSLMGILKKFNENNNCFHELEELEINGESISIVSEVLQTVSKDRFFGDKNLSTLRRYLTDNSIAKTKNTEREKVIEVLGLLRNLRRKDLNNLGYSLSPSICYEITNNEKINIGQQLSDDWVLIQPSSKNYLKTASTIYDQLDTLFKDLQDFSIYTLPLCKSFETEINLSIVQLIRKELGIPMPAYFFKFCPTKGELIVIPSKDIVPNPRGIPLNKVSHGAWLPPGLGESRLVFSTLRIDMPNLAAEWIEKDKIDFLIEKWGVIQRVRNLTAHADSVLKEQSDELEQSLSELSKGGLLNDLTSMKSTLSN
jgi:hypothetical protein